MHHQTLKAVDAAADSRGDPPSSRTRLRVGALIDMQVIRRWESSVLAELLAAEFCELTILARAVRVAADSSASRAAPLLRAGIPRHLLYRLYERADRRKFGLPDDPLSPASLDEVGIKSVLRLPADDKADGALSDAALEAIAGEGLDVLLCLGAEDDHLRLLGACARFGAWWFEAGESHGDLPLFPETAAARGDIVSSVHAVSEPYGERVICRSSTSTEPLSLHRNRNATHARAAYLLRRCLADLHERGWGAITSAPPADPRLGSRRTPPTNVQMLPLLWRVYGRRLRVRLRGHLFVEQWYVAYRRRPRLIGGRELEARIDASGGSPFTVVRSPRDRYYADPFVLGCGDRHFVFFEDYDMSTQRGAISYIQIDRHGRHSAPCRALEREYHLSYPFVFREGEAVYLMPETWSQRRIELYRATRFPCEWTLERVLMEGIAAADATLLHHHDTFWLFVALAPGGGPPLDELHLFCADSLFDEWRPHPMNPVVADAGGARPAGRIFWRGDELIRPAQDCAHSYGLRVVLNRIEVLDRIRYRESRVGSIEPARRGPAKKTHSYNFDGDYEVLDGFRYYPKLGTPDLGEKRANRALGRFRIALSDRGGTDNSWR